MLPPERAEVSQRRPAPGSWLDTQRTVLSGGTPHHPALVDVPSWHLPTSDWGPTPAPALRGHLPNRGQTATQVLKGKLLGGGPGHLFHMACGRGEPL